MEDDLESKEGGCRDTSQEVMEMVRDQRDEGQMEAELWGWKEGLSADAWRAGQQDSVAIRRKRELLSVSVSALLVVSVSELPVLAFLKFYFILEYSRLTMP